MKNRFLFVFMLLLFSMGAAVGQTSDKHWQLPNHPGTWDALNMTAKMVVQVDGVELSDPNIEMAAFIGSTLMSDGERPIMYAATGRYIYYMTLNGFATPANGNRHNRLTFKLYDHSTDTELEYTCPLEVIYSTNWDLGSVTYPMVVSFFSGEYETEWRKASASDLKSGDVVVITTHDGSDSDYILDRERGSLGGVYDIDERLDNTIEFTEPTTAANWYKKAPQKLFIYRDSIANNNNAFAFFANSGYVYSPEVDPADELEYNDLDMWPSLVKSNKQPELSAYWTVSPDGDGASVITTLSDNPYNTLQYNPDEEAFAWYTDPSQEMVDIYRLSLIGGPEPQGYSLTVNVDPENSGSVAVDPELDSYPAGTQVELTATPEEGWTFIGWYINNQLVSEESSYTVVMNEDVNIVAGFEIPQVFNITVNVSANPEEGGTVSGAGDYPINSPVEISAEPNPGYDFVYWTIGNDQITDNPYSFEGTVDVNAIAHFEQHIYNITTSVEPGDAGQVVIDMQDAYLGSFVNAWPEPAEGWTFDHWTINGEDAGNVAQLSVEITGDMEIVAYFVQQSYEITVVANPTEGGEVGIEEGEASLGSEMTIWADENNGWDFIGWTLNGQEVSTENNYTFEVTGNAEYVANFEQHPYEITTSVEPGDAGQVHIDMQDAYLGSFVNAWPEPAEGWVFDHWTVNGEDAGEVAQLSLEITGDMEIMAYFLPQLYEITVVANPTEGGEVGIEEGEATLGAEMTIWADENIGWDFANWTLNGQVVSTENNYTFEVTGDAEFVANFEQHAYEIYTSVEPGDAGQVTILSQAPYYLGSSVDVVAEPADGWDFDHWTVNGEDAGETAQISVEITGDMEIMAYFIQHVYTVTVTADPAEGGTVEFEDMEYHYGDEINVVATANEGYQFVNFTVDGQSVTMPYTITSDVNIVAHFDEESAVYHTVTVEVNPAEAGTVEGAGSILDGQQATLVASVNNGYEFVNWTVNGEEVETNQTYVFTPEGDVTVVANYSKIEYQVIVNFDQTMGTAEVTEGEAPYHYGDQVTVEAFPAEGYQFVEWMANQEIITENPYTFTVTETITLIATFELIPAETYTLTLSVDPAEGGVANIFPEAQETYEEGTNVTVIAQPNEGWEFAGWYENGELLSASSQYGFAIDHNTELVAVFTEVIPEYQVIVNYDETMGTAEITEGMAEVYHAGDQVTVEAFPAEGYQFVQWMANQDVISDNPYTFTVEGNITLDAIFELIPVPTYTLTVTAEEGGVANVFPEAQESYEEGTNVTVIAQPNEGWEFAGWYENGELLSTSSQYGFAIDHNTELVAMFEQLLVLDIEFNIQGGGDVTVEPAGPYHDGDDVTLTATPAEGYEFESFEILNSKELVYENPYTFKIHSSLTVKVNFKESEAPYLTVTTSSEPAVAGVVTGGGKYDEGDDVDLEAIANPGYDFDHWVIDGNVDNPITTNPLSIHNITADVKAVAYFVENGEIPGVMYSVRVNVVPVDESTLEPYGTVTGAGDYAEGATANLTAYPGEGKRFVNWTKKGWEVSTSEHYTFTVTEDVMLIAHFEAIQHQVVVNLNPADGGTVTGAGYYDEGAVVTLEATANEGYTFTSWQMGGMTFYNNPCTFEMGTNNVSVRANFTAIEYTVDVNVTEGEGTVEANPAQDSYHYGDEVVLTAVPATGYHLVSWTVDGETVEGDTKTIVITDNVEVTATFGIDSYTVTVTASPAEGGTVEGQGVYEYNTPAVITATANEGYTFAGWTVNGEAVEGVEPTYNFNVTGDTEIVALFTINSYTVNVTANPAEAGEVTGADTYEYNTEATVTATANYGYTFAGWTVNGEAVEGTETTYTFTVTGDTEVVANFTINNYEVTVTANPAEGGVVTGTDTYEYNTEATVTATANEGYTFAGWTVNGEAVEGTETTYTFTVTGDTEVVANFTINGYLVTVTANPTEAGEVTGAAVYDYDTEATVTVTPNYGYTFTGWTVNGEAVEGTETTYTFTVTGDTEVVANFTVNTYEVNVTANPAEGGEVTGADTYEYNTEATVTATVNEGYTFTGWTVNGEAVEGTETTYTFTVTEDTEVVANFTINGYQVTVTADPAEGGNVTGANVYDYNTEATVTAEANYGYTFINWTIEGTEVSTDAEYTFTVTNDTEVVAHFAINSYDVTVVAVPAEGGTVEGEGSYEYNTEATVNAIAAEGYTFVNWTVDGEEVSNLAEYSFIVTEDVALQANFSLNSYEITAEANPAEGGTVEGAQTYNHFETATLTATATLGYTFVNWTEDGAQVSTEAEYSFTVTGERHLVANFTINNYVVTAQADPIEGGNVTGAAGYDHGDECTLIAEANEGYTFINWTLDGEEVSAEAEYSFTVTGNAAFVAHFALNNYHITVMANDDAYGVVTGEGDYDHFAVAHLTAEANYGYHFVNWTLNGAVVSTDAEMDVEVTGEATYVANFEVTMYDIVATADPAIGGSVEGSDSYAEGTMVTLTATPALHYYFVNWTEDDVEVSTDAEYVFEATANRTLVAHFEPITFEVTVGITPVGAGTVEGAGTYVEGETATLVATANAGYEFVNWTKNGIEMSTAPSYSFEVTANVNIMAHFQLIPVTQYYEIVATANPVEGGEIEGAGEYAEGTEVTLTATAAEGYAFVNWTENGAVVAETEAYTLTVDADHTLVANFELLPTVYNVYVEEIEHAEIVADPTSAIAGELITVEVLLDPMYRVTSLYYYTDDPENTTAIDLVSMQFVMPEADVTIGAELMLLEGVGDVNLDGDVNILDVLATVNYILGDDVMPFDFEQADMNEDGTIDVSDVMAINALILGLKGDCDDLEVVYQIENGKLYIESGVALAGYQFSLTSEPASIDMPGFTTMGKWNNGEYIVLVFNLNGEKEAGLYSVLEMGDAELNEIVLATREGCKVRGVEGIVSVASFDEAAYSVFPVPANNHITVAGPEITTIDVYNMMGQKVMTVSAYADETVVNVSTLSAGSYLFRINTANGVTTKSVIIAR
jgi:hypothetical protein